MKPKLERNNKNKKSKFCTKIVVFCIAFIVLYTTVQVILSYKMSIELSPTLTTCVYSFFGKELALSAAIKVFDTVGEKRCKKSDNIDEYETEEFK